jgi:adenylyltransferase/sulfurtransferase
MAKILFSSSLKIYTQNIASCEISGSTIRDVVIQLGQDFPDLKPRLFKEDGTLRHFIAIFVDDKNIRLLEGEQTPVSADSVIRFLPPVGGG